MRSAFVSSGEDSAIPIRIVIVDDDPVATARQVGELERAGIAFDARVATGEADLRRELAEFVPDIVLCEDRLPGFDTRVVLGAVRELAPDTPVIVVSGAIGE